jgi:hypothetical protein
MVTIPQAFSLSTRVPLPSWYACGLLVTAFLKRILVHDFNFILSLISLPLVDNHLSLRQRLYRPSPRPLRLVGGLFNAHRRVAEYAERNLCHSPRSWRLCGEFFGNKLNYHFSIEDIIGPWSPASPNSLVGRATATTC